MLSQRGGTNTHTSTAHMHSLPSQVSPPTGAQNTPEPYSAGETFDKTQPRARGRGSYACPSPPKGTQSLGCGGADATRPQPRTGHRHSSPLHTIDLDISEQTETSRLLLPLPPSPRPFDDPRRLATAPPTLSPLLFSHGAYTSFWRPRPLA